jgi:hypothetical protein
VSEVDGKMMRFSFECNEREIVEAMKYKANALVLKAIAYQAADTVRWSRTVLSDLWESEHMMRDEDSFTDSISTSSSSYSSTRGTIASYIRSLTGTNKGALARPPKRTDRAMYNSRVFQSTFSIPADIVTKKRVNVPKNGSGKEWVRTSNLAYRQKKQSDCKLKYSCTTGMATVCLLSAFSFPFSICVESPVHGAERVLSINVSEQCQNFHFQCLSKICSREREQHSGSIVEWGFISSCHRYIS